jgi:hypothetical protein
MTVTTAQSLAQSQIATPAAVRYLPDSRELEIEFVGYISKAAGL